MIPYLHLGPLSIPTFGLMVALALITAAYILQSDFDRRRFKADAFTMITIAGLAGIAGAKLYHLLESPSDFFADPIGLIFTRYGFAWFGGFLGGFGTMVILGRKEKLPMREFLDACSPRGLRWLCHRAHRLPAFWRWRLRKADFTTLGHEFPERCCSDDRACPSGASL